MIAAAGVLALGWLVVSVSGPQALPIDPVAGLSPKLEAERLFRNATHQMLSNRGRLDEATHARIVGALQAHPLAAEPFMFVGIRALEAGDLDRAERFLAEARRRNPRLRMARLALVGIYLQTRRVPEASTELAVLVRLVPEAAPFLVPELARYALNPQTRDAVVEAVGADPLMEQVLQHLATNNADPALVQRLAVRQRPRHNNQFAPWQSVLIAKSIEKGDVAGAYIMWRRFAGIDQDSMRSLVRDPLFERMRGPPPFDWELSSGDVGVAERASEPALDVEYFGRRSGSLARQLIMLPPGRYRFQVGAEGSANGQGSRIVWQIACREGGPALFDLPVIDLGAAPRQLGGEFTVPSSRCASQWLQLTGISAEFPTTQSARFSNLQLLAAGDSQ